MAAAPEALFDDGAATRTLPACDHYCGVEARMLKSLALQAELGPVFDVTLDCEDGAPVGGEAAHAHRVAELVRSPLNVYGRVGARVHAVDHPAFADDVRAIVGGAGAGLAYVMVPKVGGRDDVERAVAAIDAAAPARADGTRLPVHVLIESPAALREVDAVAGHPRLESLSFGLMDFVSAHLGAIPASAMTADGQFAHPLVRRAKLEIAAACHAHGKTPSHCVVTEFGDEAVVARAAQRAARDFGYTRMWSIHPSQIRPIVAAFAPDAREVAEAEEIIAAARAASWAPIRRGHTLHDRASYRYHWRVLQRSRVAGRDAGRGAAVTTGKPGVPSPPANPE